MASATASGFTQLDGSALGMAARFAGVRKRTVAPQQDAGAPIKEK